MRSPWGKDRDRADGPAIPQDMTRIDAARLVVEGLRASEPWDPSSGELDSIDVAHVSRDPSSRPPVPASVPGVVMTWHQGENLYGLVISVEKLARQAGGPDAVPFYLRLVIDEPHGATSDGSRLWFFDLPSGPY